MSSEHRSDVGTTPATTRERLLASLAPLVPDVLRRRLAAKYAVLFLLILALIAGVGAINYVQIQETVQSDTNEELRSRAELRASLAGQWVTNMRAVTRSISSTAEPSSRFLQIERIQASGHPVAIHYVNTTEGRVVASTNDTYVDRPLEAVEDPWTGTIEGADLLSFDERYVWTTNRSYYRDGQHLVGFVSAGPRPGSVIVVDGRLETLLERFDTSRSSTTSIVTDDGKPILGETPKSAAVASESEAFAAAGRTRRPQLVSAGETLRVYASVETIDWTTITHTQRSAAFRASRAVSQNVIAIILASLVGFVVVGVVLGRQTILPIVRLRQRTLELASGDFEGEIRTDRVDEIGRLYRDFDDMRRSLRHRTRELERTNDRLEDFASVVSHDLRNPLNVAIGRVQTLDGQADDETVASIERALDRMMAIVEDVLTLAREGRSIDEPEPLALEEHVEECWSNVATEEATLVLDTLATILADPTRLSEVFENLFRNSIEHGDDDVTIRIGELADGFFVEDDGPGIGPEDREEVFEAGFTTSPEGTGFGLNIVEEIASAHGWSVSVTEGTDGGARFEFTGVEHP